MHSTGASWRWGSTVSICTRSTGRSPASIRRTRSAPCSSSSRQGKIRHIGVSNYALEDLEAAAAVVQLASYQPGYHLMRRQIEQAELPWCAAHRVGVIAYGPLAHGMLTGKMDASTTFAANDWRAASEFFTDDAFAERIAVVRELERLAADRPGGVAELAVMWVLRRPEVTVSDHRRTERGPGDERTRHSPAHRSPPRRTRRSRRSSPPTRPPTVPTATASRPPAPDARRTRVPLSGPRGAAYDPTRRD